MLFRSCKSCASCLNFEMKRTPLLFLNVIIIATCGLIYELLAGTLSSYVLGDSITQFSIIIGIYLFAMGVGSWLSRYVEKNIAEKFIDIELAVAVIGGFSAPLLFLTFAYISYFGIILYTTRLYHRNARRARDTAADAYPKGRARFQRPRLARAGP